MTSTFQLVHKTSRPRPRPRVHTRLHRGWLFYDASCGLCSSSTSRLQRTLQRHGIHLAPLQTPWVRTRLGLAPGQIPEEAKLLTPQSTILGGVDAMLWIARSIWWAWPVCLVSKLPGGYWLLHAGYRWLARSRYGLSVRLGLAVGSCPLSSEPPQAVPAIERPNHRIDLDRQPVSDPHAWIGAVPLLVFFLAALAAGRFVPAWVWMWTMALAIYAGCKFLTWWPVRQRAGVAPLSRTMAYLLAWIGMDPRPFFDQEHGGRSDIEPTPFVRPALNVAMGIALVWFCARPFAAHQPFLATWIGMVGCIFILHFGLFALLAWAWRRAGVAVTPLMCSPASATSVGDFWTNRWNTAFSRLAHEYIFRPVCAWTGGSGGWAGGAAIATLAVFAVSGLLHDLLISVPARGGYGLPTAYFMLQGMGVLAERSPLGRRLGLRRGIRGRIFVATLALAPLFWLFHGPFVRAVAGPFLHAIGAF